MISSSLYPKGKRIRPSDKQLVYRFFLWRFLGLASIVLFLLYGKQLRQINWRTFNALQSLEAFSLKKIDLPYLFFAVSLILILCSSSYLVYHRYYFDQLKQLEHRQKLAKMILQNGWYETAEKENASFFKDLNPQSKTVISHFPKMYYQMKDGLIKVRAEITMSKYQEQLLTLEKKLESGLYCELVDKELQDSYILYTLLYDTISNRITIDEVKAENGSLRLMKSVYWAYDQLPHMLIAGGTGGGKSYLILTIIEALLQTNAELYILDPKNSDLADLNTVLPNVYSKKDDMLACLEEFYQKMLQRTEEMKEYPAYQTGKNYAYLGLKAHFLIFDEYVAFMDMLGRESTEVMSKLKQIVMLGRQMGFFLILACQRPDAKYLGDGIRDQFMFRVALGRMSELGFGMLFGETTKQFYLKPIKGRGYVDVGTSVISEFYTPLVPREHDFIQAIKLIYNAKLRKKVTLDSEKIEE